ncbi:MAG TPA: serine hydrolase [Candidatus Peribacteria bacterium]|nr:serine hydrolase [Candidatus Peribacteria bacterium]
MLRAIASLLLLGMVPPTADSVHTASLPSIEVVQVAAPSDIRENLKIPALSASGAMLIDLDSGEELFSVNADTPRPMASLTKIMTALIVLEHHSLDETVTIPPIAETIGGSTLKAKPGQRLKLSAMLKALLLPSANDVAYSLAVFHGRTVSNFVSDMNERAAALGMSHTHFNNPAGLDSQQQYSSPRDLAWLTVAALRQPAFRATVGMRSATIVSADGTEFPLTNTNEMLHYNDSVFGVKTGTTDSAGECLIVAFVSGERSYLLVLLKSADRYTDALNVLQAVQNAL